MTQRSRSRLTMALSTHSEHLSGNKFTHNSSGHTRLQSFQLAEPLWTAHGVKNGFNVRGVVLGMVRPLRLRWVKGVYIFWCNLPPVLLAARPGSITWHCGNPGLERTPNKSQHTKLTLEKKIIPPLLPGFELATFRSRVRRSNQQAIPAVT